MSKYILVQKIWDYCFLLLVISVLFFLIFPVIVIVPLSFNAEPFFSFTQGMLNLERDAYSLKWYTTFFADDNWQLAIRNSFYFAFSAMIFASILGTLAALGLSSKYMPFKSGINAIILSPIIIPVVVIATGMYFFYVYIDIVESDFAIIIAHTMLGVPFVVITVSATLVGFDRTLLKAARSLGANAVYSFFSITLPIIRPGVISGALFAFVTSFDEVVIVLFMATAEQRTIPKQMFSGLREEISPTILAAATLLLVISILLLITTYYLSYRAKYKTKTL